MSKDKVIVNSWNEWDPLKHVIVGRADGCCIPAPEPALDAKVPEDSDMKGSHGPRTQDTVDKANELLNNFASMLEKRGIKVDRPIPLNHNQKISTPDWEVESMFGCMPARDIILTVGNEMLEATMSYRCRWFEYLNYRPLIKKYFEQDKNMRHETAPKPRLTDADYREDYLSDKIGIQRSVIQIFKPSTSITHCCFKNFISNCKYYVSCWHTSKHTFHIPIWGRNFLIVIYRDWSINFNSSFF